MSSNSPEHPTQPPPEEEEILLSGGESESLEIEAEDSPSPGVRVYDFRRPARLSKERKRSLEAIYGLVAKGLEGWLRGRIRDQITVELQTVDEITFGEFVGTLPSPCASFIVNERGGSGRQGIIDVGQELAFFLVDRLLGGSGQPAAFERSLTPTERLLVRIAAERSILQLCDAWKDYVEMDLNISGFESIPEMLQVANREDPVLVSTLTVTTGDMSSPLSLSLPVSLLEKFFISTSGRKTAVAQGDSEERTEERKHVEGTLRSARIPVQARFGEVNVTLRELSALKPGSVLRTGLPTESELFILVAGQKRFVGAPGKLGGKLAALVGSTMEAEPEDIIQPGRGGL